MTNKKIKKLNLGDIELTLIKPNNRWLFQLVDSCTKKDGSIDTLKYVKAILENTPERPELEAFREYDKDFSIILDNGREIKFKGLTLEELLKMQGNINGNNGRISSEKMIDKILAFSVDNLDIDKDFDSFKELEELVTLFGKHTKLEKIERLIEEYRTFR